MNQRNIIAWPLLIICLLACLAAVYLNAMLYAGWYSCCYGCYQPYCYTCGMYYYGF